MITLARLIEHLLRQGTSVDDSLQTCFTSLLEVSVRLKEVQDGKRGEQETEEAENDDDEEDGDEDSDNDDSEDYAEVDICSFLICIFFRVVHSTCTSTCIPFCLQGAVINVFSFLFNFLTFFGVKIRTLMLRNMKKQKKNFLIGMLKLLKDWKMVQLLKRGILMIKNWRRN